MLFKKKRWNKWKRAAKFIEILSFAQLFAAIKRTTISLFFHFIKDKNANAHTDHSRSCTVRCCVLLFYFASMKPIIIVPKTHNNYKGMFSNELKYKHRENELHWTNKKRSNKIIARWHTTENKKQHTQWDFELFFSYSKVCSYFFNGQIIIDSVSRAVLFDWNAKGKISGRIALQTI